MYVCVCEGESEREREGERGRVSETRMGWGEVVSKLVDSYCSSTASVGRGKVKGTLEHGSPCIARKCQRISQR